MPGRPASGSLAIRARGITDPARCIPLTRIMPVPATPMGSWLKQDLAMNEKEWLIAFWHHPPYTKGSHDSDFEVELFEMRQNAVPILESYGVDLVLCGHSHCYERSFLIQGHYGSSWTFDESMKKDGGSGPADASGPYFKPVLGE